MPSNNILFTNDFQRFPKLPVVLDGLGIHHKQEHVIRTQGVPFYQWLQCIQGQGIFKIDNKTYTIPKDSGIFLFPHIPHEYYSNQDQWIVNFTCFNGFHLNELLQSLSLRRSGVYKVSNPLSYGLKLEEIFKTYTQTNARRTFETSKLLYNFIIDLCMDIKSINTFDSPNSNSLSYHIIHFLENNFHESISLDDLARNIHLSKEYMCHRFKCETGNTIFEYLTSIRIVNAKILLVKHPNMKIKDIAYQVGYEDSSYFCSVFKKFEGQSPNVFRKLR